MISKIIRRIIGFLSFYSNNLKTINLKKNDQIIKIIFKKLKKEKKKKFLNLKKTHIKFNQEILSLIKNNNLKSFLKEDFIQKMFFLHNRLFVFYELL